MDRSLAFGMADHLRHRLLWRNRDQHLHVIDQHMALCHPAILLLGQPAKISPRYGLSRFYRVLRQHFGMNTTWYLHSQAVWLRLFYSSIVKTSFVCLAAHVSKFPRWTPSNVNPLLPPRQSRGISLDRLDAIDRVKTFGDVDGVRIVHRASFRKCCLRRRN